MSRQNDVPTARSASVDYEKRYLGWVNVDNFYSHFVQKFAHATRLHQ